MIDHDEIAAKEIFGLSNEEEYSYPNFMQLFPEQEFDDDDDDDDDDDFEDDELEDVNIQEDDEEIIREDDEDDDDAGLSKEYF